MGYEWFIDVLADLTSFAERHGMGASAAVLNDASLVALTELATIEAPDPSGPKPLAGGDDTQSGRVTYLFTER